jgi:hypothetical protein
MWGQPFGALRRAALGSNAFVGDDAGFDGVTAWAASSRARGPSEMTSSRSFARVGTTQTICRHAVCYPLWVGSPVPVAVAVSIAGYSLAGPSVWYHSFGGIGATLGEDGT